MTKAQDLLNTYAAISSLEKVNRHNSVTFDPSRRENVAEHSYSLAALGSALAHELNQTGAKLDIGKVAQFAVVHDLTEAYMEEGDISVYASAKLRQSKAAAEQAALKKIEDSIGYSWVANTIKEYEGQRSPEAAFVYALDKMVVHMNVILSGKHHANPSFSAYLETEKIARAKITSSYPGLIGYFDELCQIFKENPHFFSSSITE
jgi:5'-deoxynucleotidase YfbR-like HD superfamily hydrolase